MPALNKLKQPRFALVMTLGMLGILGIGYFANNRTTHARLPEIGSTQTRAVPEPTISTFRTSKTETADQSSRTAKARSGLNAADLYKDAFVLFETFSEADKQALSQPVEKLGPQDAIELNEKIQPIMALLRRALAEANYADWGVDDFQFGENHPEIFLTLKLGRVVNWQVNYSFQENAQQALADLRIQSQLGQSVEGRALIGNMVATSLDQLTLKSIENNLGRITPDTVGMAKEILTSLENGPNLKDAMHTENQGMKQYFELLKDPMARQKLTDSYKDVMPDFQTKIETGQFEEQSNLMTRMESEFPEKAMLMPNEFNDWFSTYLSEGKKFPLISESLPNFKSTYEGLVAIRVRRTMLSLGLSVLESGVAVSSIPDPSSGQPFSYANTATGFQLKSGFLDRHKNKPISIEFPSSLTPRQPPAETSEAAGKIPLKR